MPFTPFHMGVGVAAKAVAPRLVSIQVFGLAQIAMDLEPAIGMARGSDVLHGWTHTLWGAVPVALATMLTWKAVERRRIWRWTFEPLQTSTLVVTAFLAVWSHVLVDALIHRDMISTRALLPWINGAIYEHAVVERACLVAAGIGTLLLVTRYGIKASARTARGIWKNLSAPAAWYQLAAMSPSDGRTTNVARKSDQDPAAQGEGEVSR